MDERSSPMADEMPRSFISELYLAMVRKIDCGVLSLLYAPDDCDWIIIWRHAMNGVQSQYHKRVSVCELSQFPLERIHEIAKEEAEKINETISEEAAAAAEGGCNSVVQVMG